mgnify:CR=1 FL=1
MSDVSVDAAAPEAEAETPPALEATPAETPEVEATTQETEAAPEVDPEQVKKLRKEAADYRTKLRAAEKELEERRQAEMTETERLQAKAEQAEKDLAVLAEKAKAGALRAAIAEDGSIPADLAIPLISGNVEYDEQGDPTNVRDLLTALVEKHPQLAGKPLPSSGQTANPGAAQKQQESREDALARIYGGNDRDAIYTNPEAYGGGVVELD